MKKKIFLLVCTLVVIGMVSVGAHGEQICVDLDSMSMSELISLRTAIDTQIRSRFGESDWLHSIYKGKYKVGTDFEPGRYVITCVEPNDTSKVFDFDFTIYSDADMKDVADYGTLRNGETCSVRLEEGMVLKVKYGTGIIRLDDM